MADDLDLDELRRLTTIPAPREVHQTGSSVYSVDEREYKRWKAARRLLVEAVPALIFRVDQLQAELTGAKIFWTDAHERAEQAEARNEQLTAALQALYDDWPGPLTEAVKQAQIALALPARGEDTDT